MVWHSFPPVDTFLVSEVLRNGHSPIVFEGMGVCVKVNFSIGWKGGKQPQLAMNYTLVDLCQSGKEKIQFVSTEHHLLPFSAECYIMILINK